MNIVNKMVRAAKLDIQLYEEVEKDIGATKEAFLVVLIGAVCNGIGSIEMLGARGIITGIISGIVGWLLWSAVIYLIGVKIFKHTSDMGELLRCLGFAYSPNVLSIFGIIPGVGIVIRFIASVWVLVAFIVAARQALDCGTGRAILISVLGFAAFVIVFFVFFSFVGQS
ncbi:MAG: YIP1 family protein [Candidatus Dadabacteria bacterium]|nr:YIP1 family protein [Candidatus Dadabacteria bacterium]